jgi:hypothetical protein
MRKSLALAVAFLFSALLVASVNAGANDPAALQGGDSQVRKSGKSSKVPRIAEKKAGYSVAKEYDKRVANKKRAAELRKKLIQEGK